MSAERTQTGNPPLRTPDELEAALRAIGAERYHDHHPFNLRMHEGTLGRREIQLWAANRYYYQTRIPLKDGMILAKSADPAFRREWIQRIHDHDGTRAGEGGLELWLTLAEAVGCDRDEVARLEGVLPGVRRACDAYVELVESADLLTSVAASLTEMFAGDIMKTRIAAFETHYPWVETAGLHYFRTRTTQAPRDAAAGIAFVRKHATTLETQAACLAALERKCDILWSLLDAVERASGRPKLSPHALLRSDDAGAGPLVVLPERAVRVGGSGSEILSLCDGTRSGEQIARELAAGHPQGSSRAEGGRVEDDVHEFLEAMERQRVLVFELAPAD